MSEKEKKQQEQAEVQEQPTELELLKVELESAKKQAEEYKDKWIRNVAEFDNYKKRETAAKEKLSSFVKGETDIAKVLLVLTISPATIYKGETLNIQEPG